MMRTETTRAAAVEGERAYVQELVKETGREMIPIWLTANDDRVCVICGPKEWEAYHRRAISTSASEMPVWGRLGVA